MIGRDEIQAAIDKLNPHVAAANSVAASFGAAETVALQADIFRLADVDMEAVQELGGEVLDERIGGGRGNPKEYTEGFMQGFMVAAMARLEEER
jgi:hypothetical protein